MLDRNDLDVIRDIVKESENTMVGKMEGMISDSEERVLGKVEGMISESEEKVIGMINESEERVLGKVEEMITESENVVLGELDRVQEKTNEKFDKIQKSLNELNQYYRIDRLETANAELLFERIQNLEKRMVSLENKIA